MNKNTFMLIAIALVLFSLNQAGIIDLKHFSFSSNQGEYAKQYAQEFNGEKYGGKNFLIGTPQFEESMRTGKPIVAYFYSAANQEYQYTERGRNEFEDSYRNYYIFVKLNANDAKVRKYYRSYKVERFPAIYIIDPVYRLNTEVDCGIFYSAEKYSNFFDRYLSGRG